MTKKILMSLLAAALLPCAQLQAAETAESPSAKSRIVNPDRPTQAQELENCMLLWDATTHITKSHWKTICKRLRVNE